MAWLGFSLYSEMVLASDEEGGGWDGSRFKGHFWAEIVNKFASFLLHFFLKKGPTQASFSFIFGLLNQPIHFLQKINVKKCPSRIWCQDSNPQPFEHELSPITTRRGLPPFFYTFWLSKSRIFVNTFLQILFSSFCDCPFLKLYFAYLPTSIETAA